LLLLILFHEGYRIVLFLANSRKIQEPSHEAPAGSLFVAKSGKVGGFPVSVETSAPSTATVVAVAGR